MTNRGALQTKAVEEKLVVRFEQGKERVMERLSRSCKPINMTY
jgi:hypothetical protein